MEIVTEFESIPPRPDQQPAPLDQEYANVFDAMMHSLEVAQNVLARAAKRDLNKRLEDALRWQASEARDYFPQWINSADVVLRVPKFSSEEEWKRLKSSLGIKVAETVSGLASAILSTKPGGQLVFIEPLKTDIKIVGNRIARFCLKQKWTVKYV